MGYDVRNNSENSTAAGIVGLFLILAVIPTLSPDTNGFVVDLPMLNPPEPCGDFRLIVLQLSKENSIKLNQEPVPGTRLAGRLGEIYRRRAERVVFFRADPEVSFQQVADIVDVAVGSVTGLHLVLLTPAAKKEPCLGIRAPVKFPPLPEI